MSKAIVLASFVLGACSVGELTTNQQNPIDSGSNAVIDTPAALNCSARVAPAPPAHLHTNGGTSNQGQGCLAANCHSIQNPGTEAPGFQYAGTVMGITPAGTANAGSTVTFVTSAGMTVTSVTDTDGNFYYPPPAGLATGTLIPNPFPMQTKVDVCPNAGPSPMTEAVVTGGGDCNGGGACHGGSQGAILLDPVI